MKKGRPLLRGNLTFLIVCFAASQAFADSWQQAPLARTEYTYDSNGIAIHDAFGDFLPALPLGFSPSLNRSSNGLQVLRVSHSMIAEPVVIDSNGFPVRGDYYQLSTAKLMTGSWTSFASLTELVEEMDSPTFVSRLDEEASVAYWLGNLLYIETIASPSNLRLTLPIPKQQGSVAIDENGGVHVITFNSNYELWHSYYASETLTQTKISDGPVCNAAVVAGEGDECHVVYSTISEDINYNEALDDGEDLNGNGLLEDAKQLLFLSIDATVASSVEVIYGDTLLNLCDFDLHFSIAHGLKVAYADPVQNSIRLSQKSLSSWSSETVSTTSGLFDSLALAVDSSGECAVSYTSEDKRKLYVAEEDAGVWSESLIAQSSKGDFFTGTDVEFFADNQLAVLTTEKELLYLNLYTRSILPSLLNGVVRPTEIRNASIVTWPTPGDDAYKQVLQSSTDLADPDSWRIIEQRYMEDGGDVYETTVEHDAPSRFYRVIEYDE